MPPIFHLCCGLCSTCDLEGGTVPSSATTLARRVAFVVTLVVIRNHTFERVLGRRVIAHAALYTRDQAIHRHQEKKERMKEAARMTAPPTGAMPTSKGVPTAASGMENVLGLMRFLFLESSLI
jgi:hypothetical protein